MRLPETIERLYLDFDGFFASVEQQADKALRGRPVGVVPFLNTNRTCVIACSREAKAAGCTNIMTVDEAKAQCPDILLVPMKPDLYRRAHNALLAEIETVIPIDAVKSIDELTCRLDAKQRKFPEGVAAAIKWAIAEGVGKVVTCSIGFAANRQLAKIACKQDKPDGVTIWHPQMMPGPLLKVPLEDIPGVGSRMRKRLAELQVYDTAALLRMQPKHMRKVWGGVIGERLWYALHGYDIQAPATDRGMFGHGRVLPPESRNLDAAYELARLLLVKAARRLRRDGYYCSGLLVWLSIKDGTWSEHKTMPMVRDDAAVLQALADIWELARKKLKASTVIFRIGVTLTELTPASERQLDLLLDDDAERRRWEAVTQATDAINSRFGKTMVSVGPWLPPAGGHAGGKIAFTRIPSAEDFY
ncbi:MAG: type VI secretion protein ImpB [Proteobacteria bacterium]|nr:type VI secretion protein ImpB [Pseudomonadota bacterium]